MVPGRQHIIKQIIIIIIIIMITIVIIVIVIIILIIMIIIIIIIIMVTVIYSNRNNDNNNNNNNRIQAVIVLATEDTGSENSAAALGPGESHHFGVSIGLGQTHTPRFLLREQGEADATQSSTEPRPQDATRQHYGRQIATWCNVVYVTAFTGRGERNGKRAWQPTQFWAFATTSRTR